MAFAADKTSAQSANKIRTLDGHLSATAQWEQELRGPRKTAELAHFITKQLNKVLFHFNMLFCHQ